MRGKISLLVGVCAFAFPVMASAQSAVDDNTGTAEIIVTAQRRSETLQSVPIAISAFNAAAIDKQQIRNTSDLQLSLPNITFTKTNFTSSSFTIRGIGDLCTGSSCDQATGIHINDAPLLGSRIFEGEFFDMAQIEVLRGPQGTLFGRNATSGVVNLKTARPDLSGGIHAAGEAEYGNYNGVRIKGMLNVPLTETLAVRVAGFYLNRDGYTKNLFDNSRIDGRNMYGLRGSLRWEPSSDTTVNFMAQYFDEDDNRLRSQKQVCNTDVSGVAGCLADKLGTGFQNGNATVFQILSSKEFYNIAGLPAALQGLALGSIYGRDPFAAAKNPTDPRVVNTDYNPTYRTNELIIQGSVEQQLGSGLQFKLSGNYQKTNLDSTQSYNQAIQDRSVMQPALNTLAALAAGAGGTTLQNYLGPIANALMPDGPNGKLCTSLPENTGTGVFSGHSVCGNTPISLDRSNQHSSNWSVEGILSSKWDGPFNFLLGGIYDHYVLKPQDYFANSFALDYASGVLGGIFSSGAGLPIKPGQSYFLASPYYRSNQELRLSSYGIFGEAYYDVSDAVKLTIGLRYNHDKKDAHARTTLLNDTKGSFLFTQTGAGSITEALGYSNVDFDPKAPGTQEFSDISTTFRALTGRAVLDWKIAPGHLLYASYSRGYKSGGINPPLSPIFSVPNSFKPEFVNAFEIGSKNTFADGKLTLNLTAFYYQYKDLQLSRIVARTSVNDNVSANIYGLEAEAIVRPMPELTMNFTASYLHTKVSEDKFLGNPRDFAGGRTDAVLIKDVGNAANCAVSANNGTQASAVAFVNQANALINAGSIPGIQAGTGLKDATQFPAGSGINAAGAYSVCDVLKAVAPTLGAAFGGITFGTPSTGAPGIDVNIKGNKLPGAPEVKLSGGMQYVAKLGSSTLTPRVDVIYTGKSQGTIFNGAVNELPSYTQVNAQMQFDGPGDKWFVRAWVQNLFDENPITGLYVTDQSSGNFTNIFTLEPRRYGLTAGFKF